MDCFRSTSFGLSEQEVYMPDFSYGLLRLVCCNGMHIIFKMEILFYSMDMQMDSSDPLHGVDKENTDILMYCTGGIRCDVYSTILR